jgi:hypothetical protein
VSTRAKVDKVGVTGGLDGSSCVTEGSVGVNGNMTALHVPQEAGWEYIYVCRCYMWDL